MNLNRERVALKRIDAIVEGFRKGNLIITSEMNGSNEDAIGLDVVMATIKNHIIDGLYEPLDRKRGYMYVKSN